MTDRGFVLINVLVIIAALSVVAVGMLRITAQATTRLEGGQGDAQARLVLDAGVRFATSLLSVDAGANAFDHRQEPWALEGFDVETGAGDVRVSVVDLESRLNLNLLLGANGAALQGPVSGLTTGLGIDGAAASALIARFAVQLADGAPAPGQDALHLAGDLAHLGGLAEVPGWTWADISLMRQRFSALPRGRKLNINSAPDAVLLALPGMTPETVAALNAVRHTNPMEDMETLRAVLRQVAPTADGLDAFLDTSSDWFEIETRTRRDPFTYTGRTIVNRSAETGEVAVLSHVVEVEVEG